jgi:hypothetical protein
MLWMDQIICLVVIAMIKFTNKICLINKIIYILKNQMFLERLLCYGAVLSALYILFYYVCIVMLRRWVLF